jgi:hypothetical protein
MVLFAIVIARRFEPVLHQAVLHHDEVVEDLHHEEVAEVEVVDEEVDLLPSEALVEDEDYDLQEHRLCVRM